MSDEMKPVAWIDALALPPPEHISGTYLFPEKKGDATLALYTADQLAEAERRKEGEHFERGFAAGKRDACKQRDREIAEAVAKERERCARVCEEDAPKGDYSILGNVGSALKRAAQAIREGASA